MINSLKSISHQHLYWVLNVF